MTINSLDVLLYQLFKQQLNQSTVSCSFLIVASWPAYRFHRSQIRCLLVHPKGDQSWVFTGRTDAEAETPILWPPHAKTWLIGRLWCWEGLGAGGEGDDRGWDGWMASLTWCTWVWVNSRSWWWTGRPGVLRFMGSQRVGHDWATELNWTESIFKVHCVLCTA